MKKGKIGIGIIGAGEDSWAVNSHIPALKQLNQHFNLVAVSTSNMKSAQATANKFDIHNAFDNEYDLINHPEIQLVVVAVKVPAHDHLVRTALEAGKMVFCEWPLGNGTAEAKALTAIAKEKGIRTFAGLQAHALPELKYLKGMLAEGRIGKILSSTIMGTGSNWGTNLPNESLAYLLDPKTGANMMTIPFAQTVDGLEFVLGDFKEISAQIAIRNESVHIAASNREAPMLVHDQILLNGTLIDGTVCSIHYRGGVSSSNNLLWEIRGTKGEIVITSPIGHLQFGKIDLQASFDGEPLKTLEIPPIYRPNDGGVRGVDADLSRAVYYGYQEIVADIAGGTKLFPSFSYAVKRHEFLDSLIDAAASGCRKTL